MRSICTARPSDAQHLQRAPWERTGRILGSIFLGPKGENADTFERLLLEAFRDHVFWRRNLHPEDGFLIQEAEKRAPGYEASLSVLSQELMGLLGQLKGGVPSFSPRYIGHMCSDLTMASLIGYFATMLYNPNNVSAEASPVTTRLEWEVAEQLARMVGYAPQRQWGHLTSGGTVANFEALWVARNVKYLPVALRHAAEKAGVKGLEVRLPTGRELALGELSLWQLLNVTPEATLDALDRFRARLGDAGRAMELVTRTRWRGWATRSSACGWPPSSRTRYRLEWCWCRPRRTTRGRRRAGRWASARGNSSTSRWTRASACRPRRSRTRCARWRCASSRSSPVWR